jgi:hypothetical protein
MESVTLIDQRSKRVIVCLRQLCQSGLQKKSTVKCHKYMCKPFYTGQQLLLDSSYFLKDSFQTASRGSPNLVVASPLACSPKENLP